MYLPFSFSLCEKVSQKKVDYLQDSVNKEKGRMEVGAEG